MRHFKKTLIVFGFGILIIGVCITFFSYLAAESLYTDNYKIYKSKRKKFIEDSIAIMEGIPAPKGRMAFKNSSGGEPYMSASQGIEVHLKGLNWRGFYLDNDAAVINELRDKYDAYYKASIDKITFDPDFENNGYPDFITEIKSAPSFYQTGLISKYLNSKNPEPYKSITLNSCDNRKAVMDLWLVTFDITFRIEPNYDYRLNLAHRYNGKHPITDKSGLWLRNRFEYENMKYDRLSVLLEFKPKDFVYLAVDNEDRLKPLNETPKIGIAAVECIDFNKVGEQGVNTNTTTLGVEIEKGKSLPLYPNFDSLLKQVAYKQGKTSKKPTVSPVKDGVTTFENIIDVCQSEQVIADPNFFNSAKYSFIDIKNLGSWEQKKNWFFDKSVYKADYFHVKMLVHLYVLGEWVVKDENLIKFEARPPSIYVKPGLLDYLLPNFKIGWFGKILSALVLIMIVVLLLSFVLRPFGVFINYVLRKLFGDKK